MAFTDSKRPMENKNQVNLTLIDPYIGKLSPGAIAGALGLPAQVVRAYVAEQLDARKKKFLSSRPLHREVFDGASCIHKIDPQKPSN